MRDPAPAGRLAAMRWAGVDGDGLRAAALIGVRLRFERLYYGDAGAARWFEADTAGFAAAFRRYHAEIPARAFTAEEEGRLWRGWVEAKRRSDPGF